MSTRDLPKTGPAGESAPRAGILGNKATKCLGFQQNVLSDAVQDGEKENWQGRGRLPAAIFRFCAVRCQMELLGHIPQPPHLKR
jgi:hypothetical protein